MIGYYVLPSQGLGNQQPLLPHEVGDLRRVVKAMACVVAALSFIGITALHVQCSQDRDCNDSFAMLLKDRWSWSSIG
jgi:hypothetical protein